MYRQIIYDRQISPNTSGRTWKLIKRSFLEKKYATFAEEAKASQTPYFSQKLKKMELNVETLNWLAIGVSIIIGQLFLTVWFTALFGTPWAKAYGATDKKQHTEEIPGYTYGIGLLCTALLTIGIALLQSTLSIDTLGGGVALGLFIALFFCLATMLPGYAFLKRWNAFFLAVGSQASVILILSIILALWK